MAYVAAEAAGISARTFREWMERGEGRHPTRPATPKLRRFVRMIDRARAEARVAAEAGIYREDPKFWLTHVARSRPDREGWTEPVAEDEAEGTFEDARQILARKLGLTAAFIAEEETEAKGRAPVSPEGRPSLQVVRDVAARTNPGKREGRAS